jgi:hypothetical protein
MFWNLLPHDVPTFGRRCGLVTGRHQESLKGKRTESTVQGWKGRTWKGRTWKAEQ